MPSWKVPGGMVQLTCDKQSSVVWDSLVPGVVSVSVLVSVEAVLGDALVRGAGVNTGQPLIVVACRVLRKVAIPVLSTCPDSTHLASPRRA